MMIICFLLFVLSVVIVKASITATGQRTADRLESSLFFYTKMLQYILGAVFLLAYYTWKYYENVKRYPKGPIPLPFIGNLLEIPLEGLHVRLSDYGKKYGGIFTVWLPRPMVVITDYKLLKEGLGKFEFSGRMTTFPDNIFLINPSGGVVFAQGDTWREQRRIAITILRDFGMGKNIMEDQVRESMAETLHHIEKMDFSKPIDLIWPIQIFVSNVITKSLFGFIYKYEDCEALKEYVLRFQKSLEENRKNKFMFLAQTFSWIEHIPVLGYYAVKKYRETMEPMKAQVLREIEKSLKDYDPLREPECFAQAYYQRMTSNPQLTMSLLHNVCFDLVNAGSETTSTTLRWAILYMAKYQDVQEKCRSEIDQVLRGQFPELVRRNEMPYCCATITEIQRITTMVPLSVNHRTMEDTSIGDIKVPGDTLIIPNLWNANLYSEEFPDGHEFLPERFILNDGRMDKAKAEKVVTFGIGKRVCAGEILARVELFIGFTSFLQKFKITPTSEPDLEPIVGIVLLPKRHKVFLTPIPMH